MWFLHLSHIWPYDYSCQDTRSLDFHQEKRFCFLKYTNRPGPLRLAKTPPRSCQLGLKAPSLAHTGKQVQLLFHFSYQGIRSQPGTRIELKTTPQRFNFISIHQHQHKLDLQTLKQNATQSCDMWATNFFKKLPFDYKAHVYVPLKCFQWKKMISVSSYCGCSSVGKAFV